MAVKFLDKTGLGYFWGKIKAWCNSTFAAIAHTHTSYATKHSYTTAANAAKNWYRIANASTQQLDISKPIRAQFIVTAYNTSYDASYYETWFVNAIVFGRQAHIVIFGGSSAPFNQARILYENTTANIDANDRPAIDLYLNYQLANGTTKIEIEEVYNSGWTFVTDGQLVASTVPSGFENVACSIRGNGVERSTYADYVPYLNRQVSNFSAAFTLADNNTYRSRTLNCTGTFTITIPSINSGYMWCVIKNKNTSSGVITLHPSTTSVLIDGSNADIKLQPMEYVCIHSAGANNYSLVADGRWKSQKADKATTLSGYGITDAKIANGTITLGSNSITPLTSVPSHNQASNTVNLLTGYSKPSTGSALTTTDTLNQALGKLEAKVDTAVANSDGIPVGSVVWLSTSTVPAGFLLCNGQAVGRTTYPDLFAAIGTTYGSGDGSTTFNLPNLIDKFIEGANTNIGDSVAAGLPNITGIVGGLNLWNVPQPNGAFYSVKFGSNTNASGVSGTAEYENHLDASRSNSIYGNSSTVQPPALKLLPCIKAYSSVSNISELDAAQLENEVQNNFVHLTGDEVINGVKTFSNLHGWSSDYEATASIISIYNSLASRTETPSNSCYNSIVFLDKTATNDYNYSARLGVSEITKEVNDAIKYNLKVYSPNNRNNDYAMFQLGYYKEGRKLGYITASAFEQESNTNFCEYWLRIPSITVNQSNPVNAGGVGSVIGLLDYNYKYVSYTRYAISNTNQVSVSFNLKNPYNYNNLVSVNFSSGSNAWSYWWFGPISSNNNTINLGQAGGTWKQLYAGTAAINTSDRRVKNSIDYISDFILDIWDEVDFRQFKFNDAVKEKGDSARIHCGMIAQDIQEIFEKHDVDVTRYSFFCWDSWEAKEAVYNEKGELESPATEAGDAYALRYEELLCLEAAYQRRKNKILENRISELEKQVSDMLILLQNLTNGNG